MKNVIMSPLTYKECVDAIDTLPTMHPEPSFQNRRKTHRVLCERLTTLPSTKSSREGHRGVAELPYIRAILGEEPWAFEPNSRQSAPFPDIAWLMRTSAKPASTLGGPKGSVTTPSKMCPQAIYAALRKAVPVDYHSSPARAEWSINMLILKFDRYRVSTGVLIYLYS